MNRHKAEQSRRLLLLGVALCLCTTRGLAEEETWERVFGGQWHTQQNYFTENVILHHAQLHTLMSQNPGAFLLEDLKFNFTVLGGNRKGGLIIAAP